MVIRQEQPRDNGHKPLVADLSMRVIVALEQLTAPEQESVLAAIKAFACSEADGKRLTTPEPLYILDAAPDVRVVVRREPNAPVEVEDIFRPAALGQFTNAH